MEESYRCKKCRFVLLQRDALLTSHQQPLTEAVASADQCGSASKILFVDEQKIGEWMRQQIDQGNWTKGRITCPGLRCGARIGSFNYVGGVCCACSKCQLPPIQIIRSKVDEPATHSCDHKADVTDHQKTELVLHSVPTV